METVKFLEELGRMCTTETTCNKCPLGSNNHPYCLAKPSYERYNPQELYEIVNKWSKEHYFDVGDEVYTSKDANGNYLDVGIVTCIGYGTDATGLMVMSKYGGIYGDHKANNWHKTGRHFDEFEKILGEIGKYYE